MSEFLQQILPDRLFPEHPICLMFGCKLGDEVVQEVLLNRERATRNLDDTSRLALLVGEVVPE